MKLVLAIVLMATMIGVTAIQAQLVSGAPSAVLPTKPPKPTHPPDPTPTVMPTVRPTPHFTSPPTPHATPGIPIHTTIPDTAIDLIP